MIRLNPQNLEITTDPGETLLDALKRHQIPIAHSCEGQASCGTCRVTILKYTSPLPPEGADETRCRTSARLKANERLACRLRVENTVDVEITTTYW